MRRKVCIHNFFADPGMCAKCFDSNKLKIILLFDISHQPATRATRQPGQLHNILWIKYYSVGSAVHLEMIFKN